MAKTPLPGETVDPEKENPSNIPGEDDIVKPFKPAFPPEPPTNSAPDKLI